MKRKSTIWALAYGLVFMGLSLSIFLPFASAMARTHGPVQPFLAEICGIGGIQVVAPDSTESYFSARVALGHEYCAFCGLGDLAPLDMIHRPHVIPAPKSGQAFLILQETRPTFNVLGNHAIRGPPVMQHI